MPSEFVATVRGVRRWRSRGGVFVPPTPALLDPRPPVHTGAARETVDERLRRLERGGGVLEVFHARRRSGVSLAEALEGLVGWDCRYADAVALVRAVSGLHFHAEQDQP